MELPWTPNAFDEVRVRAVAAQLGLVLSHGEQMAFVQSTQSLDVQAAPGSGKTSLVALKLSLLAESWSSPTQGVCVLSHTNTAKDQIIERVKVLPAGHNLLRYPNFIGTIQTFADTFFALPHLRSQGITIQSIEDDRYYVAANRLLQNYDQFFTLRRFLENQSDGADLVGKARYVFEEGELKVSSTRSSLPFKPTTSSGKQFIELKRWLKEWGIFRYDDMFALASEYIHENPWVIEASRVRFPFVLLDEMQDTSTVQEQLLSLLFPPEVSVVQRVGDINQRIFDGGTAVPQRSFPAQDAVDLAVSRRFGSHFADVANLLTVHRPQQIIGEGPDGIAALLVFDQDSVDQVVPAFTKLAAQLVPKDVLDASPIRVLGSRKSPGTTDKFPQSLVCYMPQLAASISPDRPRTLVQSARAAQTVWHGNGSGARSAEALWDAVCDALERVGYRIDGRRPTRAQLKKLLDETNPLLAVSLRSWFVRVLNADLDDKTVWNEIGIEISGILEEVASDSWSADILADYLDFVAVDELPAPSTALSLPNNARQAEPGLVGTIHNAKGETHSATLILECLEQHGRKYDVSEVLALIGAGKHVSSSAITVKKAGQLIFVGATRPTHLLALASSRENATPYIDALRSKGWQIHYVRSGINTEVEQDPLF